MVTKRIKRILIATVLVNVLLVSTHQGEFWPFSIFPMFSQAGQPWSRGVVEQVQDINRANLWQVKPLYKIEDRVLPLQEYGIHPIDFANYISKTKSWDKAKINGLRSTFKMQQHPDKMWLPTRVEGFINENNEIAIYSYPLFLFTYDTTYKNPNFFSAK